MENKKELKKKLKFHKKKVKIISKKLEKISNNRIGFKWYD